MAEYVATVRELADMNEQRAAELLDDLLDSDSMEITAEKVEDGGGRDHIIALGLNG